MDDKDQSFWEELQMYEEVTKNLLGTTISDIVKEMNGEENPSVCFIYDLLVRNVVLFCFSKIVLARGSELYIRQQNNS